MMGITTKTFKKKRWKRDDASLFFFSTRECYIALRFSSSFNKSLSLSLSLSLSTREARSLFRGLFVSIAFSLTRKGKTKEERTLK